MTDLECAEAKWADEVELDDFMATVRHYMSPELSGHLETYIRQSFRNGYRSGQVDVLARQAHEPPYARYSTS